MYDGNPDTLMQQMKTIARAEMFAITIERKGGSPNPTLDQMVVAGKTS
ncbi:MAG: anti-sigma factor [Chitinophagaceae bacterium]